MKKKDNNNLKETNIIKSTYFHLDELIRIHNFAFKIIALDEKAYEDLLFTAFDTISHTFHTISHTIQNFSDLFFMKKSKYQTLW